MGKETFWMVVGHDNAGTHEMFNVPLEKHSTIELYPSKKYCKLRICVGKDGKSLLSRHVHFVSLNLQTQAAQMNGNTVATVATVILRPSRRPAVKGRHQCPDFLL